MPRTVDEWIGKTDNTTPSDACKRRILDRQDWKCAITGVPFTDGVKAEFDHIKPLWLDGENRESNLQAVTAAVHKSKTATEAKVRAKVNRNQIKRIRGKKPKSSWPHPHLKKCMDGTVFNRNTGEIVGS